MDPVILLVVLLVVAVLALGSWGYGSYAARPAPGAVVEPGSGWINILGLIGLVLLVAVVVLWATGWRFGLQVQPPR